MRPSGRRRLLAILVFAGVLSIGPFIAPTADVDSAATDRHRADDVAFGAVAEPVADIVGGELEDSTGVPEPGRRGTRMLAVALLALGLVVAIVVGARPVEPRPLRLRPAVRLLPDRRGPPTVAV